MSPFPQFLCSIKYRLWENDNAFDYDVIQQNSTNNQSIYKAKKEYDLRFFCTWNSSCEYCSFFDIIWYLEHLLDTPANYLTISWNKNLTSVFKTVSDLKRISNLTHTGYIITLPSEILQQGKDVNI
jgi:hypothetical protein